MKLGQSDLFGFQPQIDDKLSQRAPNRNRVRIKKRETIESTLVPSKSALARSTTSPPWQMEHVLCCVPQDKFADGETPSTDMEKKPEKITREKLEEFSDYIMDEVKKSICFKI